MQGIDWETAATQQKQADRLEAKQQAERNREAKKQKKVDDF